MKALELLKDIKNNNPFVYGFSHIWVRILASNEPSRINEAITELEALQQPKSCDGCGYGKTTINSVICGKNGTYKEADDYCKYYNPKEQ